MVRTAGRLVSESLRKEEASLVTWLPADPNRVRRGRKHRLRYQLAELLEAGRVLAAQEADALGDQV